MTGEAEQRVVMHLGQQLAVAARDDQHRPRSEFQALGNRLVRRRVTGVQRQEQVDRFRRPKGSHRLGPERHIVEARALPQRLRLADPLRI